MPAQATANSVMASAKRLMEFRQRWLSSSRMAEISVPAWPIPIHHTKLVMANPHITGVRMPQMPTPLASSTATDSRKSSSRANADGERGEPEQRGLSGQHHAGDLVGDRAEGVAGRDDLGVDGRSATLLFVCHFRPKPPISGLGLRKLAR